MVQNEPYYGVTMLIDYLEEVYKNVNVKYKLLCGEDVYEYTEKHKPSHVEVIKTPRPKMKDLSSTVIRRDLKHSQKYENLKKCLMIEPNELIDIISKKK